MKKGISKITSYIVIILMACMLAINYHIFIVPNNFAPAGLNGIATMIQYKTGFSISYISLVINIPLCVLTFLFVDKKYAVRTLVFTLVYSFAYLFLQQMNMDQLIYDAQGHDTIFPVVIGATISGYIAGVCLKFSSASGGMELVSKSINTLKPDANFFLVAFILNAIVAFASLFVYSDKGSLDYKPVALCITYCFISNFIGNYIIKNEKQAYKFTIITTQPDEIIKDISTVLKHGVTKILAEGAYTNKEKTVLLCVVNKHQLIDFKNIIDKYDHTFAFYELVNEAYGNFRHIEKWQRRR